MTLQAGWYRDPDGAGERWYDGRRWTGVTRLDAVTTQAAARSQARQERYERRRRRLGPFAIAIAVLAAVAGAIAVGAHVAEPARAVAARLGVLPSHHRLLPKVTAFESLDYTVLKTDSAGAPVTYNPCRPIDYVINPAGAPSDYMAFIKPAVASAERASGLKFAYRGLTTATATFTSAQQSMTPSPVVISFPPSLSGSGVGPDTVGLGGSTTLMMNGAVQPHYVTGAIALLSSWFNQQSALHHRVAEQGIVMHELGHVLGLGHVEDPGQIMYPAYHGQAVYGAGDLAGLAAEGNGAC